MNKNNVLSKLFHRYFIVALNGMALGLFCTLIIGLIIKQIAINLSGSLSSFLLVIASIAMALTGPVIGIGVAHALKAPKLVILASGVVGFLGAFGSNLGTNNLLDQGKLIISGSGDPLGAFIAVVIAAGASTVGCAAQMVGFAVISFKANRWNGLLAQGLGTSMLQVPNIMRKPVIWIPPIVASAILGPIATIIFRMENNPAGGGMGTSGLVGQLMTWQTMSSYTAHSVLLIEILLLHFLLPAIISYGVYYYMEKKGFVKAEDYKLDL